MNAQWVVIGTSPFEDRSVVIGPFHRIGRAESAAENLVQLGCVPEICQFSTIEDLLYLRQVMRGTTYECGGSNGGRVP